MLPPTRTLYFEDLSIGLTESYEKEVKSSDVVGFAEITGDRNPIHLSEHFAAKTPFGGRIAHGLYTASLISAVIGTRLPGPGAIYMSQTLNFKAPVKIGDVVVASVEVVELGGKRPPGKTDLPLPGGRYPGAGRRGAGEGASPAAEWVTGSSWLQNNNPSSRRPVRRSKALALRRRKAGTQAFNRHTSGKSGSRRPSG